MEEASVAGESPDRSKQRESSAEPTPGSASPVPEARGARDPRLAVSRDAAPASTATAAQRGGVDTATKIFSIRELRGAETTEAGESAEVDEADEVDGSGESGEGSTSVDSEDSGPTATQNPSAKAGEGGVGGDARLREAVAAWVASADEADEPDEDAPANEQSEGSERVADADDPEAAEDAEAPEEPAGDADAEDAGETSTADVTDAETAEEADESERAGDSSAEVEPVEPESGDDDDVTEGEQVADAVADAVVDAVVDARPEADDTDSGDAPEDAVPEAEDAVPEADAEADTDTDAEPPSADAATGTGTDSDTEDAPEDAAPTDAPPKAADGDPAPQAAPAADDETRTGGAGGNTKAAEGEAEAVDHPTAVFKAPRPPKPAVDQPTTMLKAPKAPETPAERTSKFVALKPLDEPRRDAPRRDTPRTGTTRPVPHLGPEHTTQQPLPPKPPLDLLAELTNTPPPPQTPVRTAVRRVKIWTPLVILLAIVFAVVQAVRPLPTPSLTLTADDSYTFDGSKADLPWPSEGQGWMDVNGIGTMGNFGKQTPVAIGSVAKAMTAYIVLKDHPLKSGAEGEKITVDATAEKEGGYDKDGESTLNTVKAGDVLTEKQALSAIMIPSANNIARLLARWDAGSEAAFIKKMNDTAKALGMTNTTYTDASGLKETTVSTAEDQVKLGNQLVKIQALMDITKLPSWVDPSGKKWTNYNRLVPYNNSLGIKTGTTTAAGGNLLFAATKEVGGETAVVVGAILGQHTAPIIDTVNAVSKTAMLAAQDAMKSAKILKKGDVVGYVDDQLGGHTPVVVTKDVAAVGWAGLKVKLSFASDAVPHSAKAGTKVGTLTVGDGSGGAVKVPVALQKDLAEPALTAKLTRLG
ncbi:D-alanyl-D-alanine carboxypeptidase [Streptomyces xylophagus]|uniref:D-alanyl-D-alanine carboxypeptidase n=1 Tax=Streptomyces xylophagus TaxID=285514 RepID=UPI0005BE0AFD|nr:D-alanyl-D-alanine carboxypeptidase [Streptomyces xylophagus]